MMYSGIRIEDPRSDRKWSSAGQKSSRSAHRNREKRKSAEYRFYVFEFYEGKGDSGGDLEGAVLRLSISLLVYQSISC